MSYAEEHHVDAKAMQVRTLCGKVRADLDVLYQVPFSTATRTVFGTLTYRADVDWSPSDIKSFSNAVKHWCLRRGFPPAIVWVAEFHQSGKVHYHFAWRVPKGITPPKPDSQGWWVNGSSTVKWWKDRKFANGFQTSAGWYLAKYLSKTRSKINHDDRYKGLRRHGTVGLTAGRLGAIRRLCRAPKWLRPYLRMECDVKKDGPFYIDPVRGLWFTSPWRFVRLGVGALVFELGQFYRGYIDEEGRFLDWDGGGRLYRLAKDSP